MFCIIYTDENQWFMNHKYDEKNLSLTRSRD